MRTFGLMANLLMISACNAPDPQPINQAKPDQPAQRASEASARPAGGDQPVTQSKPGAGGNPCHTQNGTALTEKLKAIGTEPFWAAGVEGRCVTYKTPENQQGTRVWALFHAEPQGQVWKGALNGQEFQLIVKPATPTGCSDGMSDKTYPLEAILRVEGETRKGCAERL